MITTNANVFGKRVESLVRELKYVSSTTFLRGIPLKAYSDEAREFLLSIFPRSEDGKSSINEFGERLFEGWKSSFFVEGARVGFKLLNELERTKRGKTVLASIDTGSGVNKLRPEEMIHFLGKLRTAKGNLGRKTSWVTLSPEETYIRPPREGVQYSSRTIEFIESHIMPEIKQDVSYKVLQRLKRI